jgi:hypothetical protein
MSEEKLTEQESLKLITEMIQKAKRSHFHENGTDAILWGSVVGFCGMVCFAEKYFHFYIGFDIWILTLVALIPQIFISIRERKRQIVKTHEQQALEAVWVVYAIAIFAMVFYMNIIPYTTDKLLANDGISLYQVNKAGHAEKFRMYAPSGASLMMILYAFPTLITGFAKRFYPMIFGGIACYVFFIISLFTSTTFDQLLTGFAGIGNWLIPGLILRNRFIKGKGC